MTKRIMATIIGLLMLCVTARAASAQETASFESVNYQGRFMRHAFFLGELTPVSSDLDRKDATFVLRPALSGTPGAVSFESVNYPGQFLRHQNFRLKLNADDDTALFRNDASFVPRPALAGQGAISYESINFPGFFIRHRDFHLWVEKNDGSQLFGLDASFQQRPPLAASGGGGGGGGLSGDAQAVLNAHNGYRAKHCVPDLTWSPQLAAGAQDWANACPSNGKGGFAHSNNGGAYGENLAWGAGVSGPGSVDMWYGEIGNYNFNTPSWNTSVGHFTQLVWRNSAQVGCAVASCSGQNFWVCRYSPPGNWNVNVPGELGKNVPPPCK